MYQMMTHYVKPNPQKHPIECVTLSGTCTIKKNEKKTQNAIANKYFCY